MEIVLINARVTAGGCRQYEMDEVEDYLGEHYTDSGNDRSGSDHGE